jgi:hypothetical protein
MTLIVLLAVFLFLGCFLLFLFLLPRYSPERTLLEQVTQPVSSSRAQPKTARWMAVLSVDAIAKPFTFLRSFFSAAPDPDLMRRLLLAGYRKPSHADMFLGARLALPALLGVTAAFIFTENAIIFCWRWQSGSSSPTSGFLMPSIRDGKKSVAAFPMASTCSPSAWKPASAWTRGSSGRDTNSA